MKCKESVPFWSITRALPLNIRRKKCGIFFFFSAAARNPYFPLRESGVPILRKRNIAALQIWGKKIRRQLSRQVETIKKTIKITCVGHPSSYLEWDYMSAYSYAGSDMKSLGNLSEGYNGYGYFKKEIKNTGLDLNAKIWYTGTGEKNQHLVSMVLRNCDVVLIMLDVTVTEAIFRDELESLHRKIRKIQKESAIIVVGLAENDRWQAKLNGRDMPYSSAHAAVTEYSDITNYFECTYTDGHSIDAVLYNVALAVIPPYTTIQLAAALLCNSQFSSPIPDHLFISIAAFLPTDRVAC